MKKRSFALVAVALGAALVAGEAAACGDKFLVIGRTARSVRKAQHPAAILLVLREDARLSAAIGAMKLESTLKKAGHAVEVLPASVPLADKLAAARYDFIVTGLSGLADVVRDGAAVSSPPDVIPVALDSDGPARASAETAFPLVIRAPSKSLAYLAKLDAAMAGRRKVVSR